MPADPDRKVPPWALAVAAAVAAYLLMFMFESVIARLDALEVSHAADQGHDRGKRSDLRDDSLSIHSELEEERVAGAYHRGVMEERSCWLQAGHYEGDH